MSYMRHGLLNRLDKLFAENYVRFAGEREGCLCTFLFHGLFRGPEECRYDYLDIQQGVTVEHFETFIEYFLDKGYIFVRQEDILKGLSPQKRYAYITFDDGYFNNIHALAILKRFQVPATFYISTDHVMRQRCFWWDVLARERWKQGTSVEKISQEQNSLKSKQNHEIEDHIIGIFGAKAFDPIGEVDRPLTAAELRDLARHPFVEIGNHTHHHAILTNYPYNSVLEEMRAAQKCLKEITGVLPIAVSYPNGSFSVETITAAKEAGFKIGITTREGKNYLPLNTQHDELFCLKRFTLWGDNRFAGECSRARSDLQVKSFIKQVLKKV